MTTSKKATQSSKSQSGPSNKDRGGKATSAPASHKPGTKSSKGASAPASSKPKYRLLFHPEALEEWRQLDNSVRAPLKKLLSKRLENPHVPGGELHPPLSGCYKIKLKKAGVRLVYAVEDDALVVYVLAADKREDSAAYASAGERTSALAAQILAAAKKKK